MKYIHKQSVEVTFFKLITSDNEISQGDMEGVPTLIWKEDGSTTNTWTYETQEQRDHDYAVIKAYRLITKPIR
jgi:hypothetical protein